MKLDLRQLTRAAVLAALAIAVQLANLPQLVTGPAVNAVLYVASLFVSPLAGVFIGVITPWTALVLGIMKLAPAVPVIMAGNVSLCLTSGLLNKRSRYVGMGLAALVKFGVMTAGMRYLISSGTMVPAAAYASLTTTQLVTALLGGLVALAVLEALGRMRRGGTAS